MKRTLLSVPVILLLATAVLCQAISQPSPFACNRSALTPADRNRHFDQLGPTLRAMVKQTHELRNGYEFQFPADRATYLLVAEWAAGEHLCCPFFDIDLRQEREQGAFWMRLSGGSGVKQFIQAEFAKWLIR